MSVASSTIDLRIARSSAPVLITGETGTGKELTALALHNSSGRSGDFVAVNCAALPDTLAESELFGHVRGAFTGADSARVGAFVAANRGTIFLDEIGDAPRSLQAKLLRVLSSGGVVPVGASKPATTSARLVCATNVDLRAAVNAGTFRADLLYRIDVLRVSLLPLRERSDFDDVARNVLVKVNDECGTELRVDDWSELRKRPWPGNVRELQNVLTRMAVESVEDANALVQRAEAAPTEFRGHKGTTKHDVLAGMTERQLLATIEARGSQRAAAEFIGCSYGAIQRRLASFAESAARA